MHDMFTTIIITLCYAASAGETVSEALHNRCLAEMRDALANGKEFVKVHAAESLLWTGNPGNVREVFLKGSQTAPRYRIGVWRVLAQAAPDAKERKAYEDKILAVLLDPTAPDRTHAAETLGKLEVASRDPEIMRLSGEATGAFQAMVRWVVANSGTEQDEAQLAALLASPDRDARGCTAYALRFFKAIRPATYEKLKATAEKEPVDSPHLANMLSPWYRHAPAAERPGIRARLLKSAETGGVDAKREVCAALGRVPDPADIPFLLILLADADLDVRATAAETILRIERSR
jgi:SSS family solute:Na+ symporter